MIKSHPLTLTMKARPNCQRNIGVFVWSFSFFHLLHFRCPSMIHQAVKTFGRLDESFFSFSSCNLNGFERFLSSWFRLKFSWRFLRSKILPMNTNTLHTFRIRAHSQITSTHFSIVTLQIVISFRYIVIIYTNIIIIFLFSYFSRLFLDIKSPSEIYNLDTFKQSRQTVEETVKRGKSSTRALLIKSSASRDTQAARCNHSISRHTDYFNSLKLRQSI